MTVHQFSATSIDGVEVSLSTFKGKVLLIVNVASRCGFTPQYQGLEALYRKYKDRGFVVLGFPCNQFGRQEPGTEADIERFCKSYYDVTFPLFAKVAVNGPRTHPLYRFLKTAQRGVLRTASIKWNFTKFLVDRTGHPVQRHGPRVTPEMVEEHVQQLLKDTPPRGQTP